MALVSSGQCTLSWSRAERTTSCHTDTLNQWPHGLPYTITTIQRIDASGALPGTGRPGCPPRWMEPWRDSDSFCLALEGPALQVLIDLSSKERCDLQALTAALNCRFGQRTSAEQRREELTDRRWCEGENVGTFAADIRVYARKGYPTFPAATREELEELSCGILHLSDSASMSACCHPEI